MAKLTDSELDETLSALLIQKIELDDLIDDCETSHKAVIASRIERVRMALDDLLQSTLKVG